MTKMGFNKTNSLILFFKFVGVNKTLGERPKGGNVTEEKVKR